MTYGVRHPDDENEQWAEVREDAVALGDPPLVEDATAFKAADKDGQTELNVFGHGNQADIGGKAPSKFAEHLLDDCEMPPSIRTITLHSCMSGVPDPRRGNPSFGKTYAEQLHAALLGRFHSTDVKGQKGLAFTDSTGATRVLKTDKNEDNYKRARNHAVGRDAKIAVENEYLLPADKSSQTWTAVNEANPFIESHEAVESNELWKAFQLFPEPAVYYASKAKYRQDEAEDPAEGTVPRRPEDMRQRKFWSQLV
jgi:hypothetical protein